MSSKQKTVIRLGVPNDKNRSKAMQLASKFVGVNSVAITGEAKVRLEVVGESIDIACLINRLRKKVCRADDIVVVEEVKDNKKEEEEEEKKKKKEEEAKKKRKVEEDKEAGEEKKKKEEELKEPWAACPPPCSGGYYPGLPQTFLCEENNSQKAATSCEATYYYLRWILPGVYA